MLTIQISHLYIHIDDNILDKLSTDIPVWYITFKEYWLRSMMSSQNISFMTSSGEQIAICRLCEISLFSDNV